MKATATTLLDRPASPAIPPASLRDCDRLVAEVLARHSPAAAARACRDRLEVVTDELNRLGPRPPLEEATRLGRIRAMTAGILGAFERAERGEPALPVDRASIVRESAEPIARALVTRLEPADVVAAHARIKHLAELAAVTSETETPAERLARVAAEYASAERYSWRELDPQLLLEGIDETPDRAERIARLSEAHERFPACLGAAMARMVDAMGGETAVILAIDADRSDTPDDPERAAIEREMRRIGDQFHALTHVAGAPLARYRAQLDETFNAITAPMLEKIQARRAKFVGVARGLPLLLAGDLSAWQSLADYAPSDVRVKFLGAAAEAAVESGAEAWAEAIATTPR
jgi:hypothetical protein